VARSEDRDADEVVLLDRAGRLQIPRDYVRALGLAGRVRMVLETDHIRIIPAD
jgi:putative ABC transport system ATP-binding protein